MAAGCRIKEEIPREGAAGRGKGNRVRGTGGAQGHEGRCRWGRAQRYVSQWRELGQGRGRGICLQSIQNSTAGGLQE